MKHAMKQRPDVQVSIIRLPIDLRDTLYYRIYLGTGCDHALCPETFSEIFLDMLKEPILAIASIYNDLLCHSHHGMLNHLLDTDIPISEPHLANAIGLEISSLIDYITELFRNKPEQLELYNRAIIINNGIVLMHADSASDADILGIG